MLDKTLAHRVNISCSLKERKGEILLKQNTVGCCNKFALSAPFIASLLPWDQVAEHSKLKTQSHSNFMELFTAAKSRDSSVQFKPSVIIYCINTKKKSLQKEVENSSSASLPLRTYTGEVRFFCFPINYLQSRKKIPILWHCNLGKKHDITCSLFCKNECVKITGSEQGKSPCTNFICVLCTKNMNRQQYKISW